MTSFTPFRLLLNFQSLWIHTEVHVHVSRIPQTGQGSCVCSATEMRWAFKPAKCEADNPGKQQTSQTQILSTTIYSLLILRNHFNKSKREVPQSCWFLACHREVPTATKVSLFTIKIPDSTDKKKSSWDNSCPQWCDRPTSCHNRTFMVPIWFLYVTVTFSRDKVRKTWKEHLLTQTLQWLANKNSTEEENKLNINFIF